jgi:hypothetical protein
MTDSIMPVSIMTVIIMPVSIMTVSIRAVSIMTVRTILSSRVRIQNEKEQNVVEQLRFVLRFIYACDLAVRF